MGVCFICETAGTLNPHSDKHTHTHRLEGLCGENKWEWEVQMSRNRLFQDEGPSEHQDMVLCLLLRKPTFRLEVSAYFCL